MNVIVNSWGHVTCKIFCQCYCLDTVQVVTLSISMGLVEMITEKNSGERVGKTEKDGGNKEQGKAVKPCRKWTGKKNQDFSSYTFQRRKLNYFYLAQVYYGHCLVGLAVKASTLRVEDPGFKYRSCQDFSGSSHTSDFNISTPVATLIGVWRLESVLGLVGPVSVYCDWVKWEV